jgi:hypothetical protein
MSKTRKEILADLIKEHFGNSKAEFARTIKRSPAQVSQWLSGNRQLGDAGARIIEKALALPLGFFDQPYGVAQPKVSYSATVAPIPVKQDPHISAVVKLMQATDLEGRAMALAAVKVALNGHVCKTANSRK